MESLLQLKVKRVDRFVQIVREFSEVTEAKDNQENIFQNRVIPHVYSGWATDPFGEAKSRFVSGGQYTPFVICKSGVIIQGRMNPDQLKSGLPSVEADDSVVWKWEGKITDALEQSLESSKERLMSLPPEIFEHVLNGHLYSNPFWSDEDVRDDADLVYRASALCIEWNRRYEEIWIECQTKLFSNMSLNRKIQQLNSSPLNQEVIALRGQIWRNSISRYQEWVQQLAENDPEHHARVVFYEQQNQLLAAQRQQTAVLQAQRAELQNIRYAQENELRAIKNQIERNKSI